MLNLKNSLPFLKIINIIAITIYGDFNFYGTQTYSRNKNTIIYQDIWH